MAAARQNEMKVNITVVATKTFTAGWIPQRMPFSRKLPYDSYEVNPLKIAQGRAPHRSCRPRKIGG